METTIRRYIRKPGTNEPRGVVVAVRCGDEICYGYSLLNTSSDKFNKKRGVEIAKYRALSKGYKLPDLPDRETMVTDAFKHLQNRAIKYFKDIDRDKIEMVQVKANEHWSEE